VCGRGAETAACLAALFLGDALQVEVPQGAEVVEHHLRPPAGRGRGHNGWSRWLVKMVGQGHEEPGPRGRAGSRALGATGAGPTWR
jgi:hypothetical protein